jgi:hypothetical protein
MKTSDKIITLMIATFISVCAIAIAMAFAVTFATIFG